MHPIRSIRIVRRLKHRYHVLAATHAREAIPISHFNWGSKMTYNFTRFRIAETRLQLSLLRFSLNFTDENLVLKERVLKKLRLVQSLILSFECDFPQQPSQNPLHARVRKASQPLSKDSTNESILPRTNHNQQGSSSSPSIQATPQQNHSDGPTLRRGEKN